MREKIYTIPVNEAFDKMCDCPVCSIFSILEKNELDIILGASMMEPDIREMTNKQGFCERHFEHMLKGQKRLSLALILDSHLDSVRENLFSGKLFANSKKQNADYLSKLENDCYICSRINTYLDKVYSTIFYLYSTEREFRIKCEMQPLFCLPHFKELLSRGQKELNKKDYEDFYSMIMKIEKNYLETLSEDIKWFCKKFDYRFAEEDWKNSKDAIERVIYTLTSEKL